MTSNLNLKRVGVDFRKLHKVQEELRQRDLQGETKLRHMLSDPNLSESMAEAGGVDATIDLIQRGFQLADSLSQHLERELLVEGGNMVVVSTAMTKFFTMVLQSAHNLDERRRMVSAMTEIVKGEVENFPFLFLQQLMEDLGKEQK